MNMPPPMEGTVTGQEVQPNTYAYVGVAGCWICNSEQINYSHIFYGVPIVNIKLEPRPDGFLLTLCNGINVVAQHVHVCTRMTSMESTPITEGVEDFDAWKKELGWDE